MTRHDYDGRIIPHRATPTPEDQYIFARQLNRVLKDCDRHCRTPAETLAIVRRWTFDYLGITT